MRYHPLTPQKKAVVRYGPYIIKYDVVHLSARAELLVPGNRYS